MQRTLPGVSASNQQSRYASTQQQRRSFQSSNNTPQNQSNQQIGNRAVFVNRRKRRFADKIISPDILALLPDAEAYMRLLSFEQKLDSNLARKKLDFQEMLKRPLKVKSKLRIYVSHSFMPGKEPEREGEEGSVPMWELRVEGRLLEDPVSASTIAPSSTNTNQANPSRTNAPKRKFSSFFKSLVIELDKDIYGPDNHLVEWHRTLATNETDGFQVKRPGDRDVKCTILLLLDHQPIKSKLHPRLAKLLGIAVETSAKVTEALWQYIKTHKLQDSTDRDSIICDTFLEQIFNCKKMRFMEIPQRLTPLLQQPDPLVLNHTIKYNGQDKNTACYDIEVEVDDPCKQLMSSFIQTHSNMLDISVLDQKIYELIEQVNEFKVRRDFYHNFAENPYDFVQSWLISQSKDLKNITEINSEFEIERKADYYYQPHTQEGVFRYIYGKVQQKRIELEATLGVRNN